MVMSVFIWDLVCLKMKVTVLQFCSMRSLDMFLRKFGWGGG
jgi:hypothetical protein